MNITVKKTEINKISNNILQNAESFNSEIQKLLSTIDNISLAWEGADALEYIAALKDKYIIGLQELNDMVERYGNYLKNIPEPYQVLDENFLNKKIDV